MPVGVVENGSVLIEAENGRFNANDPLITLIRGDGGRDNGNGDHILFAPGLDDGENLGAPQGEGVSFDVRVSEGAEFRPEVELSRFTGSDESDKGNDIFLGVRSADGRTIEDLLGNTGGNEVNFVNAPNGEPTVKVFANGFGEEGDALNRSFIFTGNVDGEDPTGATDGNFPATLELPPGDFTFTVFARSDNVGLDSFALTEVGAERATEENFADDNQDDDQGNNQIVADDFIFELVDTDSDSVVATVEDGDTISLSDVSESVALVLTTKDGADGIESVTIASDGVSRTERVEPFAQFGDDTNGDFFGGDPLEEGEKVFQISVDGDSSGQFDFSLDVEA